MLFSILAYANKQPLHQTLPISECLGLPPNCIVDYVIYLRLIHLERRISYDKLRNPVFRFSRIVIVSDKTINMLQMFTVQLERPHERVCCINYTSGIAYERSEEGKTKLYDTSTSLFTCLVRNSVGKM